MLCWQRLSALDRLAKWEILDDSTCPRCKQAHGTHQHLFLECYVTKKIRALAMKHFGKDAVSSTLEEEVLRLSRITVKKSVIASVYVITWFELMYMIWITSCNIIYQSMAIVPEVVARRVVYNAAIRLDDYQKFLWLGA